MGNNRNQEGYSAGYDPKAVEHDLRLISQLMHGKKKLTMQLAQEIYYRIKSENLQFESDTGREFLEKITQNTTDAQRQEIDTAVRRKKVRKQNRKRLLRINRRIAIVMSVIVLAVCVLCLNWSLLMDQRTNYQTRKLQAKIYVQEDNTEAAADVETGTLTESAADAQNLAFAETEAAGESASLSGQPRIMEKFALLYEENPDFAGWLRIPGTKIDYPVMSREGDNDYYLDKNFAQQQDKNGLLILDYRSDVTADGQNLIIYGHNMRTGVMFGTLKDYKDKAFCDEHMTIWFDTLYEEREYRVVAAMLAEVAYEDEDVFRYYDAIDISTEEDFNAFRENLLENALYTTEENIEYGDTCLLLSTCDNYTEDGRFVVVAKYMGEN